MFSPIALASTHACTHAEEGSRESVDAGCRRLTATWVRERAAERRGERAGGGGSGGGGGEAGGGDVEMEDAAGAGPSGSAGGAAGGGGGGGGGARGRGGGGDVADIELCEFYEGHERAGVEALLPPGEWGRGGCVGWVWVGGTGLCA